MSLLTAVARIATAGIVTGFLVVFFLEAWNRIGTLGQDEPENATRVRGRVKGTER